MSNLAYDNNVTSIVPHIEARERRVADTDDGYTRLANDLYDELNLVDLNRNELKVAHTIVRKTYGFNKKTDRIADSQIVEKTNLSRQAVNFAKNSLLRMRVLLMDGTRIGINKVISEWDIRDCHRKSDSVIETMTESVIETMTALSQFPGHTKDNITKEKKDSKKTMPEQVQAVQESEPEIPPQTNQLDEAFETIFWIAGMRKEGKKKALSAFKTQFKEWRKVFKGTPGEFSTMLAEDIACRIGKQFGFDKLHPASYLNGKRWEDEKPEQSVKSASSTIAVYQSADSFHVDFSRF